MERTPLGVAVVGAGYWGPNLVRNFYSSDDWSVRCVIEPDRGRRERLTRFYPSIAGYAEIDAALEDPRVDAVALATPPRTHYPGGARDRGREARARRKATRGDLPGRARPLRACPARRSLPTSRSYVPLYRLGRESRALREAGDLGKVYYIDSVRVNLGLFQESNVLWDLAPHDIATINYLLDDMPSSVALVLGSCVHAKTPDVAFLTMWYPSGCLAHVHLSWLSPVKVRRTMVSGSRKMAVWDDLEPTEKIYIYDKGVVLDPSSSTLEQQMVSYRLGDVHVPLIDNREALAKLVADFAAAIRNGSPPRSDGTFGAGVVRVIEAALRSADAGGAKVDV